MTFIGFILGAQVLLVSPFVMSHACPGDIGCYSPATHTILIDDSLRGRDLDFALMHEVGHLYLKTSSEDVANAFAHAMLGENSI